MDLERLQQDLKHHFKDIRLLKTALTHSSYANEKKDNTAYNERLEFLGDSVLGVVVSDYIFNNLKHLPEGELTRIRAALVCEKSCCDLAKSIHLGDYLYLGRGEDMHGGRERVSIRADAFEAVIAAIYLDGGMEAASNFILSVMGNVINDRAYQPFTDYKSRLQEVVQQNKNDKLTYKLIKESGPDHAKVFEVEVLIDDQVVATASGTSKKNAEQNAAKAALEQLNK